ncbi:unnamed protein product [Oikopleura dioica]|uniref:VWFD domain-containing protein n=1 Tax=Oikopleura dioica TaxID=34765 RepID=E4Z1L8_OIKDI|nr:unnamed protein product [Oikopleura dioica]
MTGLCGNYNKNDSEERILAIEYADESEDFGDRFQTDDDDTCAHGERLRPCEDLSSAAYDAAADRCDIVDQNPRISENQNFFRGCEFLGNRSPFYEACLFNSCLERDLHCGIIGDFASQCLSKKATGSADYERICDWASRTGCEEECPESQVFKGCTTPCFEQQTCEDVARGLSKEDRCADSGELVEGMCGCPDGHVLDEGVCLSENSCGCINEAGEYAAVGSKQIVGPEECTCTAGGEYECVELGCPCDKFDEECIDFVCEAPRNFDAGEEGYVGKFIPPQQFEISFEWLCEESLTTTKYVQGPHIIDIESVRSTLSENPSDMLPGIEDEGKQKKKRNRNGSARSGRISHNWFVYVANTRGSAVLAHTNGGFTSPYWVQHWLGAGRGPQCIPGFNEMKLTQVFNSETNTYIMKTFLNNIEIGNLDIPLDQYFQVESELAVYVGSPWSDRRYAGMLGQIRNFYMRDLSKQYFIGETPEISGGRVALKDIDLEKSFRVSMELDCNEWINSFNEGTVWDIRDKDIPRSESPSSNPAILDDEESRFDSISQGKAYTQIYRYLDSAFTFILLNPGK